MSDPLRDRLGSALGAGYELQRLLGKGGMGSVYLARETALDRLVAVKVLPPEVAGDAESRERFKREARTAAKLTHPHIVPLYSFGEADGLLWFVMGYVAGETLAEKLERTTSMDPEQVRRILSDVADALDYAHGHKIVHRDVKPDNILIEDTTGKALLADFGVARAGTAATTLTTAGALVGTPLYMSPEQASGEKDLDGRSDLYSLGVVGYRMLAGRPLFEGTELRAVLAAHITQPPPSLPEGIPDDLALAVMRAIAKAPVERWASGREMRDGLGATGTLGEEALDRFGSIPSALVAWLLTLPPLLLFWNYLRERPWVSFTHDGVNALLTLPLLILLTVVVLIIADVKRQRLGWREALRAACWPPAWWSGWWPSQRRRPGDVWARLPEFMRRTRTAGTLLFIAYLPGIWVLVDKISTGSTGGWIDRAATGVMIMAVLGVIGVLHLASRRLRALGLRTADVSRALTQPTWNAPFWSRPEIARVLLATDRVTATAAPSTPVEIAAEVRRIANALPSHHAALAQEAVVRAERVAKRIGQMDRELASLAEEVRRADVAGVEARLAELGPAKPDEPEARRAIRAMNEQQLAILRRLTTQLEEGQAKREEQAGMLRTLLLQVSELKVATARLTDADTSGVRAIVDRMGREVEGLREVGG